MKLNKITVISFGILIIAVIILSIKLSSPFGDLFWAGVYLFIIGLIGSLYEISLLLWKWNAFGKLISLFTFFLTALVLIISLLITTIDYRTLTPFQTARTLPSDEWNDDIDELHNNLKRHPGYHAKAATVDSLIRNFKNVTTESDKDDKLLMIIQLLGTFNDGHTLVIPFQIFNKTRCLPIYGYYFEDGFYILKSASEYEELIGKKIQIIGNTPIDEVFEAVISAYGAENEWNARYRFPIYMVNINLLSSLGITDPEGPTTITYQDNDQLKTIEVYSEPFFNWFYWGTKPTNDRSPTLVAMRKAKYRLHYGEILELELNQITDGYEEKTIEKLAVELEIALTNEFPMALVIDLRNANGGDNTLYQPLINAIVNYPAINTKDRLFVLTSRATFSAAINLLDDMKNSTNSTVIGEPPGAGASHFGDGEFFMLPNSGIYGMISTKQWKSKNPNDTSNVITPDIPVKFTYQDHASSIDPWMAAVDSIVH